MVVFSILLLLLLLLLKISKECFSGIFVKLSKQPHMYICGTCHKASLSSSLPKTATPTIFSETILQTCQHQLPQALASSTAHRNITSLQMGRLSRTSCATPAYAEPLLTTSVSLTSHFSTSLPKPRGLNFFQLLPEHFTSTRECPASSQNLELTTKLFCCFYLSPIVRRFSRLSSCYQVHSRQDFFYEDSNIFSCISSHPETLITILLQKSAFGQE